MDLGEAVEEPAELLLLRADVAVRVLHAEQKLAPLVEAAPDGHGDGVIGGFVNPARRGGDEGEPFVRKRLVVTRGGDGGPVHQRHFFFQRLEGVQRIGSGEGPQGLLHIKRAGGHACDGRAPGAGHFQRAIGGAPRLVPGGNGAAGAVRQGPRAARVAFAQGAADVYGIDTEAVQKPLLRARQLLHQVVHECGLDFGAQVPLEAIVGNGHEAGGAHRALVDGDAVRLPVGDGRQHSLARCHATIVAGKTPPRWAVAPGRGVQPDGADAFAQVHRNLDGTGEILVRGGQPQIQRIAHRHDVIGKAERGRSLRQRRNRGQDEKGEAMHPLSMVGERVHWDKVKPLIFLFAIALVMAAGAPTVSVARLPEGGTQAQSATDSGGTLHVIYLKGEPAATDIWYVRRARGETRFSAPVRVNSQPGSAMAIGSIRGPQLAVTGGGHVHVAWNGSKAAEPKAPGGELPMLYTRWTGGAFAPQRNLIREAVGLDGGGAIAADDLGNVWVAWHAGKQGEARRRVWVARSRDDGATFTRETAVTPEETGACGCCGMKAMADGKGGVYFFYRSATNGEDRDMWLVSETGGGPARQLRVDAWKLKACPMSSASLVMAGSDILTAWETAQQVYWTDVAGGKSAARIAPPGDVKRRHPTLARNRSGDVLLAWTEGTGWQKGGSVAWQLFDPKGKPAATGHADGLPVWGLAAATADPLGNFTIVY